MTHCIVRCPKCGKEVTTGLMAVFCECGDNCHFFPEDNATGNQDFVRTLRDEHGLPDITEEARHA